MGSTGLSSRFGRIDTLIHNAGIFIAKPFSEYTDADFRTMLGVNLAGFFHVTQLAIVEMEKRGRGHIVQITTSLVDHARSTVPSVLASLTKGRLAAGVIKTAMHKPEMHAQLDAIHPIGRAGDVSDIVGAIDYLESAEFVTGETIHADGGQAAGH